MKKYEYDEKSEIEEPEVEKIKVEELIFPKESKKKKDKYKVVLVGSSWVVYDSGGSGLAWTDNVWKDLKIGDEVSI